MPPPAIQGVGNAAGFTLQIELRDGSFDLVKLQSVVDTIVANARTQSGLQTVMASFRASVPQYTIEIDREKTKTVQLDVGQVFSALAGYFGSSYVNQFNKFGRVFQVYVQGDAQFRLRLTGRSEPDRPQHGREHDPARHAAEDHAVRGPVADQPVQSLSVRHHHRRAGDRLLVRRRASR